MNKVQRWKKMSASEKQRESAFTLATIAEVGEIDVGLRSRDGSFQIFSNRAPGSSDFDAALRACRYRNAGGHDVYFRPARGVAASVIMLDDLTADAVSRLARFAHLAVETSPQNFQIWIKTDQRLDEAQRAAVQRALVAEWSGDIGSVSGEHFGRLPGFVNRKPKYRAPWVNVASFSLDAPALAVGLLTSAQAANEPPFSRAPFSRPHGGRVHSDGESQESHREFKFACNSLLHNVLRDVIVARIAERALARGKRKTAAAALKYSETTVDKAAAAIARD